MNKNSILLAAVGFFAGISMMAVPQSVQFNRKATKGAVSELFAAGNQEARELLNSGVTFIEEDVMLSELIPFAEPESDDNPRQVGRFGMQAMGSSQNFLVLDTATGVVRGYYAQSNEVVVYNARVPNHAARRPLRVHDAFETVR